MTAVSRDGRVPFPAHARMTRSPRLCRVRRTGVPHHRGDNPGAPPLVACPAVCSPPVRQRAGALRALHHRALVLPGTGGGQRPGGYPGVEHRSKTPTTTPANTVPIENNNKSVQTDSIRVDEHEPVTAHEKAVIRCANARLRAPARVAVGQGQRDHARSPNVTLVRPSRLGNQSRGDRLYWAEAQAAQNRHHGHRIDV